MNNKKQIFRLLLLLLVGVSSIQSLTAQIDTSKVNDLNEVVVKATRATDKTGTAYSTVTKKELQKTNLGQDIPFLLNLTPSVVVTSDAGTGIGYTGIRIRGSDATRINVTLNGIPYNDAESQGVFWVNMPDFASSISSVQVQRGVGTSTNGAGAFGGSINVNTLQLNPEPYAEVNATRGSFNTQKYNLLMSTGLLNEHFVVDGRVSKISSDGYVDRAFSDLQSFYLSGGYYDKQNFVRLNVFGGKEQTYQSWYGVPEGLALGDREKFDVFTANNYYSAEDAEALWQAGPTYNFYSYDNETDNYSQDHAQLIGSFKLGQNWRFNPTLHYTYGRGYYEQYRSGETLADYGLDNVTIGSETIENTDLIRRKWLDNDFYGTVWSLDYEGQSKLTGSIGGGYNKYVGRHFGEIIWAQYASNSQIRDRYYENTGDKTDFNIYARGFYQFTDKLNAYADIQYRTVGLDIKGTADARQDLSTSNTYSFFNPKVGLTMQLSNASSVYTSFAVGNKEPSRQDIVDATSKAIPTTPKAENLKDLELGYRLKNKERQLEINGYYMAYRDQLVLTGAINNVGEAIRVNVPNSFRRGVEIMYGQKLGNKLQLALNLTLSQNQIKNFTEVVPSYDDSPNEVNNFSNTDIAFSPSVISGGQLVFLPCKGLEMALMPKYVGKQYLDNTANEDRIIQSYFISDFRTNYSFSTDWAKNLSVNVLVNNVFNKRYASNGYTYSYLYDGKITDNFLYPQAGTNILVGLQVRF